MNVPVHRDTDSRVCGASTIVQGQSNVYVNNLLASVKGDPNSHKKGELLASVNDGTVFVNGKLLVLKGSDASPDKIGSKPHDKPKAVGASGDVFACGGGGGSGGGGSQVSPNDGPDPTGAQLYSDPNVANLPAEETAARDLANASDPSTGGDSNQGDVGQPAQETVDREQQAMDFYTDRGYTPEQAAGIVGNLTNESSLNPTAINPNDAGPGRDSEGIAQWNRDRLSNLQGFAAERGTTYTDYETQLAFVDHELRGTGGNGGGSESAAYNRLQNATTAGDSAVAMSTYERYRGYELGSQGGETQQRMADAGRILGNNT